MPRGPAPADPPPAPPDGARRPRRARAVVATVVATALVLVATLRPGDPAALEPTGHLCLVCGREGGADVVRNVLLFLPLGAALAALGPTVAGAAALGAGLSLLVEAGQLLVVPGRAATLSDLLTNTAGTVLGWVLVASWPHLWRPAPRLARRLAAGALLGWTAVAAGGAWAVTPELPGREASLMRFPPGGRPMRSFEGAVRSLTLNGASVAPDAPARRSLPGGALLPPLPPALALRLPLRVEGEVHAMYPPGMLRPLVFGYTPPPVWDEAVVFGQRGRRLLLRVRTRATYLRLPDPTFALDEAFPASGGQAGRGRRNGEVVRVAGHLADGRVRLEAERGGATRSLETALTPYVAWSLVLAPLVVDRLGLALSAGFLAALALLPAFWGARAARAAATPSARLGALAALAAAGALVLALPAAVGLPGPAWWEWLAAAAGIAAGWALGLAGRAAGG